MEFKKGTSDIMHCLGKLSVLLILLTSSASSSLITSPSTTLNQSYHRKPKSNHLDLDLQSDDANPNFYGSDLDSYENPSGSFFDHFPDLSYFPEFGEIFRLSRTTTASPPFQFPSYVHDAFPTKDSTAGDRRPERRRPPRPASSGTRTKISKHSQSNDNKEKMRAMKSKPPSKGNSRTFPKIFRFTSDRVNLADFDTKKKVNENYMNLIKGDELDSERVKRNEFLILHGGVFEIEPSARSAGLMAAASDEASVHSSGVKKRSLDMPYFYKR